MKVRNFKFFLFLFFILSPPPLSHLSFSSSSSLSILFVSSLFCFRSFFSSSFLSSLSPFLFVLALFPLFFSHLSLSSSSSLSSCLSLSSFLLYLFLLASTHSVFTFFFPNSISNHFVNDSELNCHLFIYLKAVSTI